MCGFIGKLSFEDVDAGILDSCNSLIECRGPDSKVINFSNDGDVKHCFIFNRLSIFDLSENANQPMIHRDSGNILMFNGEIFNHNDLRNELVRKGVKFYTNHSDTEVVLNGLVLYGIEFISKLRGQFAIFYYDKSNKKALLIRDRVGQKPLYYSSNGNSLIFGSNLKSIVNSNNNKLVNESSLDEYLRYGVVSSPNTIFNNYYKVEPAQIVEIKFHKQSLDLHKTSYWNIENYLDETPFILEEFLSILDESINIRTEADVDVASILSGGLDSTTITKFLSKSRNIETFSVVNDEPKYDESKWSNQVAETFDTKHKILSISSKISNNDIIDSLESLDEPYSDPSVVPSYKLYNEVSKYYKVAISGDGGDELLGGYKRTFLTLKKNNIISSLMKVAYNYYPSFLGTGSYFQSKSSDNEESYKSTLSDEKFINLLSRNSNDLRNNINLNKSTGLYKSLLISDYKFFLPEQMLFKVDRTSMANSLEIRSPFVDHMLIEYIISHNSNYLDLNRPKSILKDYLVQDFGKQFVDRKKQGFVFDLETWVFNNLDTINETLDNGQIVGNNFSNPVKKLSVYKSRINALRIWRIFTLENYLQNF